MISVRITERTFLLNTHVPSRQWISQNIPVIESITGKLYAASSKGGFFSSKGTILGVANICTIIIH